MPFDDDAEADLPSYRPPPHPDDRLWRHPSEMGSHRIVPVGAPAGPRRAASEPTTDGGHTQRHRPWGAFVAAGAVGAVLAGGGVMALGIGERVVERPVTQRVELNPSVPALGAPDAGTLGNVRQQASPAVVGIAADGAGSGVVVRDDGIVVTSTAFVTDGTAPTVSLPDGRVVSADLVGSDAVTGLAVLDLKGDSHTPSVLGTATDLRAGDQTFALHAQSSGDTAADAGVVGPSQRYVGPTGTPLDGFEVAGAADALALGGPLVDPQGAVVGIVTAVEDGASWYVTPVEVVDRVTADLLADGVAHHAWLGIEGTETTEPEPMAAESTGPVGVEGGGPTTSLPVTMSEPAASTGTLVASVVTGSPAAQGGLAAGDVIVGYNDRPIARMPDLTLCLRASAPGDRVDLTVERADGGRTTLVITLSEAPPP